MAECVRFKHSDGTYTVLVKKTRRDKHGRELKLFTVEKKHVPEDKLGEYASCKVVEPYSASKSVIGNAEMGRYVDFVRKVKRGELTRAPTKIIGKITLGL